MFNKHELNNQITGNKKSVTKAKISIINKLVKKGRKLRNLIEKTSNDKFKKKSDKITEQIAAVKKLNCLNSLKKAIFYFGDPQKIITNEKALLEDVAEMLIFSSSIVTDVVQRLRTLFNIKESDNLDWREVFRKSKKNKKNELESNEKSKKQSIESKKTEINKKSIKDNDCSVQPFENETNNTLKNSKRIFNSNKNKFESKPDLFFTTENGQNYISVSVENEKGSDEELSDEDSMNYKRSSNLNKNISSLNKISTKVMQKNNKLNRNSQQEIKKLCIQKEFRINNNHIDNNILDTNNCFIKNEIKNSKTDLHPSWQAKQKIKPIIHEFKGVKLTFDD